MRRYNAENLLAPYHKAAPRNFWDDIYVNGTYTLDVSQCNWTCEGCWSGMGGRNRKVQWELTPEQVVEKMIRGMKRNTQGAARITYGEPMLYAAHTRKVIDIFLERTRDLVIDVEGVTRRGGEPLVLIVETNGSLLTRDYVQAIDRDWGVEAERFAWSIGVKATNPHHLARLTGMPLEVSARNHARQLEALRMVAECEYVGLYASFLDEFSDGDEFDAIKDEIEALRPGRIGVDVSMIKFSEKWSAQSTSHYTPKRMRSTA